MGAEGQGGGKNSQTPEQIALENIAKSYGKGAPGDIEAQLEEMAGLEPSVTNDTKMQSHLLTNMADQHSALEDLQTAATPQTPIQGQMQPQQPQAPQSPFPQESEGPVNG